MDYTIKKITQLKSFHGTEQCLKWISKMGLKGWEYFKRTKEEDLGIVDYVYHFRKPK